MTRICCHNSKSTFAANGPFSYRQSHRLLHALTYCIIHCNIITLSTDDYLPSLHCQCFLTGTLSIVDCVRANSIPFSPLTVETVTVSEIVSKCWQPAQYTVTWQLTCHHDEPCHGYHHRYGETLHVDDSLFQLSNCRTCACAMVVQGLLYRTSMS